MKKFFAPTNDIVFKRIFGHENNKPILIDFLSAILNCSHDQLQKLKYSNTNLLTDKKIDKNSDVDILLEIPREGARAGTTIDIEMQVGNMNFFSERMLYYLSKLYISPLRKDAKYYMRKKKLKKNNTDYALLNRVIMILISADGFLPKSASYYNQFELYDPVRGSFFTDLFKICTIELYKDTRTYDNTNLCEWVDFFRIKKGDDLNMLKSKVKNEYVKAAIDQYSGYVDGGYEDVLAEIAAEKKILDRNAYINQARKEGLKEGKIELAKKLVYEKKWTIEEALNFVGLDNSYENKI